MIYWKMEKAIIFKSRSGRIMWHVILLGKSTLLLGVVRSVWFWVIKIKTIGLVGKLVCPDPNTFCERILSEGNCKGSCFGRGTCVNNKCQCEDGWGFHDCTKNTFVIFSKEIFKVFLFFSTLKPWLFFFYSFLNWITSIFVLSHINYMNKWTKVHTYYSFSQT